MFYAELLQEVGGALRLERVGGAYSERGAFDVAKSAMAAEDFGWAEAFQVVDDDGSAIWFGVRQSNA
jgi:hypothetical protein